MGCIAAVFHELIYNSQGWTAARYIRIGFLLKDKSHRQVQRLYRNDRRLPVKTCENSEEIYSSYLADQTIVARFSTFIISGSVLQVLNSFSFFHGCNIKVSPIKLLSFWQFPHIGAVCYEKMRVVQLQLRHMHKYACVRGPYHHPSLG